MNILRKMLLLSVLLLTLQTNAAAQQRGWHSDYQTARELARSQNATLLVHVFGPECPPCQRMERTVFTDPAVQQALTAGIVAVKIDGAANPALIKQLGVRSYPSDVITRPGKLPFIKAGAVNRDEYLAFLNQIAAHPTPKQSASNKPVNTQTSKNDRKDLVAPEPRSPMATTQPTPQRAEKQNSANTPNQPLNSPLIGLDGFCPVTLYQQRRIKPGNPRYTAIHQGIRYQCASAEFRDLFRANPERYAPAAQGCDPIALVRDQRAVPGTIRFGVWYAGKLYLFQSNENLQTFKAAPLTWSRVQSARKDDDHIRR
jgi:YHS domain-containing protein/thiol-disulfide isomerase/thioredoxin